MYGNAAKPKNEIDAKSGTYWTIAYRKKNANHFKRAGDLATTWDDAGKFAEIVCLVHPELQVWIVTNLQAELDGYVHVEDRGNIMVDSGKRVRIADTGSIAELDY